MHPLELHRYKLIALIMQVQDVALLIKMEEVLEKMPEVQPLEEVQPAYMRAVKPLRKGVTLEQLVEESGYKPITWEEFYPLVENLNIEEPIEDLLAMLTP